MSSLRMFAPLSALLIVLAFAAAAHAEGTAQPSVASSSSDQPSFGQAFSVRGDGVEGDQPPPVPQPPALAPVDDVGQLPDVPPAAAAE